MILRSVRRLTAFAAALGVVAGSFWAGYLTIIGLAARRRLARPSTPNQPGPTDLRVLIPAHNEQRLIGATLDALHRADQHGMSIEVHVVADNCSDDTVEVARAHGATVHERTAPDNPGKGAALAWLLDQLKPGAEDAIVVIVDADTIVDPAIFVAFSSAFADPNVDAVQGYYTVLDPDDGEVGFRAIALAVRHLVRPAGRTALGGSSSLYGNGMGFRESVAREYRWSNSLTEDLEMGLRLLLDGRQVGFAPDAIVAAEMPDTLEGSTTQNERWEAGRIAVAKTSVPGLLTAMTQARHGRTFAYLDAAIDISMPPFTTLVGATAAATVTGTIAGRGTQRWAIAAMGSTALALQAAHVVQAMALAGTSEQTRRALRRGPAQMLWKTKILARSLSQEPADWVRTARVGETAEEHDDGHP